MNSSNSTVIVTSTGSGRGLAVIQAFVREGAHVVLNGRGEEKLVRAAAPIDRPGRLAIAAGDVTRPESAQQLSTPRRRGPPLSTR